VHSLQGQHLILHIRADWGGVDGARHALEPCFSIGAEAREHGHADWREAAATVLQALLAWPASEAFRQPVDPGYAAYHKVGAVDAF
jgi:hypothetical protein